MTIGNFIINLDGEFFYVIGPYKISLHSIKMLEENSFIASLYVNGRKIGEIENDGSGNPFNIYYKDNFNWYKFELEIRKQQKYIDKILDMLVTFNINFKAYKKEGLPFNDYINYCKGINLFWE